MQTCVDDQSLDNAAILAGRSAEKHVTRHASYELVRFYVDGTLVRTTPRAVRGTRMHGDPKEVVIRRNSTSLDVVGSASVKHEVDLLCQA